MKPLHSSEAKALLSCPRKWEHAYRARRVPARTSEALSRGTAVHQWLALWWSLGPERTPPPDPPALRLPEDPIARACCLGYAAYWLSPPGYSRILVEQPFTATVGGVEVAGTVDALCEEWNGERTELQQAIIVEHKTTSQDIGPGSLYWRQVVTTDLQVSMYRAAFPGAKILYDVIRKPDLEHRKVPLLDEQGVEIVLDRTGQRVQRKGDRGWRRTGDAEKGYVLQTRPETDDELVARCLEAMAKEPEKYFQRATVVRLQAEDDAFATDVRAIDALRRLPTLPRNPASCFEYGTRCGYWDVCWEGASLYSPEFRDQDEDR